MRYRGARLVRFEPLVSPAATRDTATHEVSVARLPRYAAPGMPQHVIQRGTNRSVLFAADADYHFFRECLGEACAEHRCRIHAYVLMTNHVHLLITPASASGIGDAMQAVGRRYARRFNDTYQRTGHLWDARYKATLVDTEQYLWACHQYIELNPVRAGLAAHPGQYRWSSYRANAFGHIDAVVTPHEQYRALGPDARARQAAYRTLFNVELPESALTTIRDSTNKGWPIGGKRFREEVAELLARRTQPAFRGRRARRKDEIGV